MVGIRVDASDYRRFAGAVRGADKDVRRALSRGIREAAKPLGAEVVRGGAEPMPARGGLRDHLLAGKVGLRAALGGARPSVTLRFSTREGWDLDALNRGQLRHQVFGHDWWVDQRVPAGSYADAFNRGAPLVRKQVQSAVQGVLDDITRKA